MSAQLCKHYLRFLWKNIIKENPFIKLSHNLISRVLINLTWFMWFKSSSIITTKWRSQRCWYFKSILGFCLQGNLGKEKINLKSFCFRNLSLKNRQTAQLRTFIIWLSSIFKLAIEIPCNKNSFSGVFWNSMWIEIL